MFGTYFWFLYDTKLLNLNNKDTKQQHWIIILIFHISELPGRNVTLVSCIFPGHAHISSLRKFKLCIFNTSNCSSIYWFSNVVATSMLHDQWYISLIILGLHSSMVYFIYISSQFVIIVWVFPRFPFWELLAVANDLTF